MKILIYGAGVLGSFAAARLAHGGQDMTVLARGRRLEDIRRDGIVLERFEDGARTQTRLPVVDRLGPEDAYDLVLVVMGMNQAPTVLPALAANRRTPNVLFIGNSVSGDELTAALGKDRVLRGFLLAAGTILTGGAVRYGYDEGRKAGWVIGEPDGSISPRLLEIAAVLDTSGIKAELSQAIDAWLKTHAAMISALGAAVSIAGGTPAHLADDPAAAALAVGGLKESLRALQKLGVPLLPKGVLLYLWVPAPILRFLLRRMLRSEEVAFGFAHADKARPEIRLILDEMMVLYRRSGRPLAALEEMNRRFR
jgi:2-dehydropantoate 2-reductase